ncbi:anthranilate synthase component II [Halosimplex halophilum]|uniref:anthranilate synthase component II n=1 Tax=Halosimplex halophilum TaxID=2559572 RepID=UPI00107F5764|nr:aminodeoxychorismate/anthranilate synthase component II [Halosimplex halophilum]
MTEPSAPGVGSVPSVDPDATAGGDRLAADATAVDRRSDVTVLVVDNYDSFSYNLVQYVGEVVTTADWLPEVTGGEVVVRRNDAVDAAGIREIDPDAIVVSPGPGTPQEAGVSMPIFRDLDYPTLGVCLGHQALCAVAGAPVGHAEAVVHGKPSTVGHDGRGVFRALPDRFEVGRYHSLAVERADLPDVLEESAHTDDEADVLMAVRHRERPHVGVQFHPESILTEHGKQMIETFCRMSLEGSL